MPIDPLREQLLAAVAARLSTLTADGTTWYMPGEVSRDWKNFDEAKGFPCYGVIEGPEEPDGEDNDQVHEVLTVTVVGWVKAPSDRRIVLNRAIGDVKRAIYLDETWGGLALWTAAPRVETDEATIEAKPFAYFELTMAIHYDRPRRSV